MPRERRGTAAAGARNLRVAGYGGARPVRIGKAAHAQTQLDAIGEQLTDDGLVFRYRNADGLQGGESAFTTCIFWYVLWQP